MSDVRVHFGLVADDKWNALRELCRFASREGVITAGSEDEVHAAVVERERSLSTGLEMGLAVPHAFSGHIAAPALVIGVASEDGIPWDALDGEPARFVALLLAPSTPEARGMHLQILARLSGIWCDQDSRTALLSAPDPATVQRTLSRG